MKKFLGQLPSEENTISIVKLYLTFLVYQLSICQNIMMRKNIILEAQLRNAERWLVGRMLTMMEMGRRRPLQLLQPKMMKLRRFISLIPTATCR